MPSSWYRHVTAGNSSVEIPYQPRIETSHARLDDGSSVDTTRAMATIGEVTFFVLSNEFEAGVGPSPLETLDELLDGFLGDLEGLDIVASDAAWLNGHPGTVLEVQARDRTRDLVVRQYIGRSRAYLFGYAVATDRRQFNAATERHFFSSIQLDARDALSPAGTGRLDYATWSWVYPPEADFAAEMPGAPRREDGSFMYGSETYDTYTYVVRSDDARTTMRVRYIPIYASARGEDVLTRLTSDAAQGGTLRGSGPTMRTGYGGQALVIDTASSVRFVLHILRNDGVFEIVHEMPRSDEQSNVAVRRRFFNSFVFP